MNRTLFLLALKLATNVAALSMLVGCGIAGEPGGLVQWPNGNCAWPCIGGGGGGGSAYGMSYRVGAFVFTDVQYTDD